MNNKATMRAHEVETLAKELKSAMNEAARIEVLDPRDGGTCNFDQCVIRPGSQATRNLYREAMVAAGIHPDEREWRGRKCFFLDFGDGQGSLRTRQNKAVCAVLEDCGWPATMFYMMD